ncbi:MAG: hypothetical protein J0M11_11655 [Anaerolineae bacterium]|nr:hypothetical protein [Anaerolineae bacterium]
MKVKSLIACTLIMLTILIAACGAPDVPQATEEIDYSIPADTETPASVPPTDIPVEENVIIHTTIPVNLPDTSNGVAADFDSSKVLANGSLVGGDRFTFGRFERPFNANTMDTYYAEIDIISTEIFQDDVWIFGRLSIKGLDTSGSKIASYAMEFDTTLNGKANWLILSGKPNSTDWSVDGVQIYNDANADVGGTSPYRTDESLASGDGFETLVFDQGGGADSDAAWTRISPTDPNLIEFAIKRSAIEQPAYFMVNMWAGYSLNPSIFDINDRFTHEQAGAADAGLEYFYPIKAVAEVDNSCRIPVGFQPTGNEPGLCATPNQIAKEGSSSESGAPGRSCPVGQIQQCDPLEGCWCVPAFSFPPPVIIVPPGPVIIP